MTAHPCVLAITQSKPGVRVTADAKALPTLRMPMFTSAVRMQQHKRNHVLEPCHAMVDINGSFDADALDVDNLKLDDPFGKVEDVMTAGNLRYVTPDQPLSAAAGKLDKVTGLAVLDENKVVVGVISIKDINRLKKAGNTLEDPIKMHMSVPPIVVKPHAKIGEAAAVMLSKKIHRLPVVDNENKLIGIVSRTDIFRPLLNSKEDVYQALSVIKGGEGLVDALQKSMDDDALAAAEVNQEDWQVKYLYDGDCSMCLQLVSLLKGKDDGRGLIYFVNIASMTYDPRENEGVLYEEAMETIHAIKRDGTIIKGPEALKLLYSTVGFGWLSEISSWPIISNIVEIIYDILSKLRLPMGKSFDAVLAMRRMKMTEEGIEHCVDDEEACNAEW